MVDVKVKLLFLPFSTQQLMDFLDPVKRKSCHQNLSLWSPQESEEIERGHPRQIGYGIREKHPSFLRVVDKHNPCVSSNANSWAKKKPIC